MLVVETGLLLLVGLTVVATGLTCCFLAACARADRRYGRGLPRGTASAPLYRAPSRTRPARDGGGKRELQSAP